MPELPALPDVPEPPDLPDLRIGTGYDIHRLEPGSRLVLGGVEVPSERGFHTHSDGDVLSHAVVDALAGAISDGDLGTHFPEDDPRDERTRSLEFIGRFLPTVHAAGYRPISLDSFVVLGPVRLRPHLAAMRDNLSAALQLDPTRVSVKARSNDGLGLEGEGLACSASVTVLLAR